MKASTSSFTNHTYFPGLWRGSLSSACFLVCS